MCDTFVVLGKHTKNGKTLFAKNSDRDPDETQNIVFLHGGDHLPDETVECTYMKIPQVEKTYDVILSKPFWMWGGEIGVNEFGLAIGNEAVFTTEPLKESGLLGMDMIRLALERTKTAKEGLDCVISLLEEYGQGGGTGYHDRSMSYHNSWIIADPDSAYVLETADEHWVWKKIKKHYHISNILTIEDDYDEISEKAIPNAIKNGRCKSEKEFSFKKCYSSRGINMKNLMKIFGKGKKRRKMHQTQVDDIIDKQKITIKDCFRIIRSHQPKKKEFTPEKGSNGDVCWHASGFFHPSQTVNSMVAELGIDISSIWSTCGSAPCIQVFRPLFLFNDSKNENEIPSLINQGLEFYDHQKIWWKNERMHRLVLQDYIGRIGLYSTERDEFEKGFIQKAESMLYKSDINSDNINLQLQKLSEKSFKQADELVEKWIQMIRNHPIKRKVKNGYLKYWDKLNKKNKLIP
ncbi:MAG: C69 family dipeptidase [Promethearchaeota archaeon]